MERFSLEKKVPSALVSKQLLGEIERYLINRLPKKLSGTLNLNDEKNPKNVSYILILKDSFGEETIGTIEDYHRDKFANDIKDIIISYSIGYRDVDIRVRFSKSYSFSDLKIEIDAEGAKEITLGIYRELIDIICNYKTIHSIFYHKPAYAAWALVGMTPSLFYIKFPYSSQIWLFVWLSSLSYFLLRFIAAPYSTFATFKREKIDKAISWFLNGMAGVFIFGVIAMIIRNKIL